MRLVILLALTACAPMTPEERGIVVDYEVSNLEVFSQRQAMLDLETLAEERYTVHLDNLYEESQVWWTTTICPGDRRPAVIYRDECFAGRMWDCREMYSALPISGITCGSALLHEFAHCLRMEIFDGDGDASHSSDIWQLVAEAHERSCIRELGASATDEDWQKLSNEHIEKCGFEQ